MDYILYHANCQDGWVSAFVGQMKYPEAKLMPMYYGMSKAEIDGVFKQTFQKDVLMVDYSFPSRELVEELYRTTKSLRIFDHHISKKDVLSGLKYAIFDNNCSGAGLTWDYLFGIDSSADDDKWLSRPWWVSYTEDQDLWTWKLKYSRVINSYLIMQERSILRWNQIATITSPMTVFDQGLGALARTQFNVRDLMRNVQEGLFHGHKTGVINTSIAVSEVGEAIYNSGFDIAMSWHERVQGDISFGLRSTKVDVGAIAKSYGGGGHKNASGFETSLEMGRKIIDVTLGRSGSQNPEGWVYEHNPRCC